jgi:hypothetical protein
MKEALKQVFNLVERFERNIEAYQSPAYNETQLRREFVDPFFEALGWDVTNKEGNAEQYKDVIHEQLPIRTINFSDPTDKARHDQMVKLVEQMISLHKQLATAKIPDEKARLARQIDATGQQIDRLVYELYGLAEEEIKTIEQRT